MKKVMKCVTQVLEQASLHMASMSPTVNDKQVIDVDGKLVSPCLAVTDRARSCQLAPRILVVRQSMKSGE